MPNQPTSVLDVPVSLFRDAITITPFAQPLLIEVLAQIKQGVYRNPITQVRRTLASQGEEAYKKAKAALVCMTPACTLHTRDRKVPRSDKVASVSNIVHYDLDKLDDHDGLKRTLCDNPHVAFVFTSPRGNGLKIGIAASGITTENYKQAWWQILRDLKQRYPGGTFVEDHAIQYINALCFVSDDPDLYMKLQATPIAIASSGSEDAPPPVVMSPTVTTDFDVVKITEALTQTPSDNYHDWITVGQGLHASGHPLARGLWDWWSSKCATYNAAVQEQKWRSFTQDGGRHLGDVYTVAHKHGWRPPEWGKKKEEEEGKQAEEGLTSHLLRNGCEVSPPHEIKANGLTSRTSLTSQLSVEKKWPVLLPEALTGLAGEVVKAIVPHTESDPAALLVQFLTMFGVVIGRQSYGQVEATRHYGNLFTVIAGRTARSRKGTSYGHIEALMYRADSTWTRGNHIKGAGSGEGLVYAVRDRRTSMEPIKEKGRIVGYEEVELDAGVADKRALYMTGEFSSVLKVASREGNTLSETLRDIWDTGHLRITTRHNPLTATDAHIGIVGHITIDEIQKLLTSIDMANGFANRFLWICAQRSKELPDGGDIARVDFQPMIARLQKAIAFSQQSHHLNRTAEARKAWHVVYGMLSENRTGLADTLLARAEAIVFRLSILYALLDCSAEIHLGHLNAALALWHYAEDSAVYIFGETVGDETADPILAALRVAGDSGLTREQLTVDVFQRHIKAPELTRALTLLATQRRISQTQRIPTGGIGRPVTLYHLAARQSCEVSEVSTSRYLIASNDAAKQPDLVCEESAKKVRSKSPEVNGAVHGDPVPAFTAFTASSLWCPTCRSDHAVTLVGREYHCVVCGAVARYRPGEDGEMQQTAGAPPADVRVASEPAPELQLIKADSTTETSATSSNPLIDGDPNTDAPATRPILPGDGLAGVYAPRDYRTWMTGKIPITQGVLQEPLPPPTQHDTPSACATYRGTLCQVKACDGHRERFRPSGLCTRCWGRAKKVTHAAEVR